MNLTFQEKSIWVSLVSTVVIFGYYFSQAFGELRLPHPNYPKLIGLFIGAVVLIIIVEIVLHIVLAIAFRKDAERGEDEREKLIELKATRISYFVLVLGVWTMGMGMLITASPFAIANTMMFFFILAEIVGFSTQLFYYRRGI